MAPKSSPPRVSLAESRICVLYGGRSSEREVSLSSGACILEGFRGAMERAPQEAPSSVVGVEILADGCWLVDGNALAPGLALEQLEGLDLFFLGLHGTDGEDGVIQGFLSLQDRRFSGSGVGASAIAMDKQFTRCLVSQAGLRIAQGTHFSHTEWEACRPQTLERLEAWGVSGWVVKPRHEGSSVGVSVVHEFQQLGPALEAAFLVCEQVLVEEFIQGVEVAAAVLDDQAGAPQGLPIVEICPKPGHFFDYREKYSDSGAIEHCPPKHVDHATCEALKSQAIVAHQILGCQGYSRSDFIVPSSGAPVFLETNTLPGMTPRSLLPLAAAAAGIEYPELCLAIARAGLA